MDKKKVNIALLANGVSKTAVDLYNKAKDKTVQIIDQNDDGKVNMSDVSEIVSSVGDTAKKTVDVVKESANEKMKQVELKALQPIFIGTLDDADFMMTKLIRICDVDKKHSESELCAGSIGYFTDTKGLRVVNIYRDKLELFGIKLFPDTGYEFYYIDPSDRDKYIALDEYFSYLKVVRVNELQMLAQQLGAKHFKVTFKEEKMTFSSKNNKKTLNVMNTDGIEANHQENASNYSTVDIAAEFECDGHAPIMPKLKYLQRDENVQNLINMRMHQEAPLKHQKIMIKLSNSSGIKETDAVKIDAVLKGMKCSGNASVENEVKNELRRYLEYEVDF